MTRMVRFSNNAVSKLASAITASSTTITLQASDGAKFPTLTGNQFFMGTLVKSDGTTEVVKVTARTGDTLTVVRAAEAVAGVQTAYAFAINDRFEHRLTAKAVSDELDRLDQAALINPLNKSANYTITAQDVTSLVRVNTSGGAVTITLPDITTLTDDFDCIVAKVTGDANVVTIARSGTDTINGATSYTLTSQWQGAWLTADRSTGTWTVIASGGSGVRAFVDTFTGTGTAGPFTLSGDPGVKENTAVYVGGVYQQKSTYTLVGTSLTLGGNVPVGVSVEVVWAQPLQIGITSANLTTASDGSSGSLFTTVQGFITRMLSSAGSAMVGFIAAGTGAVLRFVQDKLRETVSVKDFGAKGDGTTDDYTAIIAARDYARTIGAKLHFPASSGAYVFGTTLDFSNSFENVTFDQGVTLKYTGAGFGVQLDAGATGGRYGGSFGWGCPPLIQAPSGTIAVYVRAWHHGRLDFTCNAAIAAALRIDFAVCSRFRVVCSVNRGAWVTRPVNGIQVNKRNTGEYATDCTFENPIIEGVSGDGIVSNGGQYNLFLGGTTEGNGGTGYAEGPESLFNKLVNVFCEANGGRDFYLNGTGSILENCTGGTAGQGLNLLGSRYVIREGSFKTIQIESTSAYSVLDNVGFYDTSSGGSFVDNSSTTIKRNLRAVTPNGYVNLPDASPKPSLKRVGGMAITGASKATKCVLTINAHGLDWGDSITIASVVGMTQLNGNTYSVEPIDANNVYILSAGAYVNSTAFGTYTSGGTATWLAFQNSWANFGSTFEGASFSKSADGYVTLSGVIANGAGNTSVVFTLPVGFRPAKDRSFVVSNSNAGEASANIYVDSTGRVYFMFGSATTPLAFVSLDNVRFLAA